MYYNNNVIVTTTTTSDRLPAEAATGLLGGKKKKCRPDACPRRRFFDWRHQLQQPASTVYEYEYWPTHAVPFLVLSYVFYTVSNALTTVRRVNGNNKTFASTAPKYTISNVFKVPGVVFDATDCVKTVSKHASFAQRQKWVSFVLFFFFGRNYSAVVAHCQEPTSTFLIK